MSEIKKVNVDVIIVGAGLSGSSLALALERSGLPVALIDKSTHPRFALGESLLKPTVLWLEALSRRFNVPELGEVANFHSVVDKIGPSSGVKKCFGFIKHELGKGQVKDKWWLNSPVEYESGVCESHLFRQDIDAFLFNASAAACHFTSVGSDIVDVEVDEFGAKVLVDGAEVTGKFIVDCTGHGSILANKYGLRQKDCQYKTNSQSIFSHLINCEPFDSCYEGGKPAISWNQGTLHHLLDDAWVWVIPFGNHDVSVNNIVSVGVTFSGMSQPSTEISAEALWQSLLQKYPLLRAQFGKAKHVRPWVRTGRLQYSSTSAVGDRYCLIGAAYGNVDALFSRGMLNTFQSVYLLAELLIDAKTSSNFSREKFEPLDTLLRDLLTINDLLTYGCEIAFNDPQLTDWWLSCWRVVEHRSISHANNTLAALDDARSDTASKTHNQRRNGHAIDDCNEVIALLRSGARIMEYFQNGEYSAPRTIDELERLAHTFDQLGFDFPSYKYQLKSYGFFKDSSALLQTEQAFMEVIRKLDKSIGFEGKLSSIPIIGCLIRLLSLEAPKLQRELREKTEAKKEFGVDELGERIIRTAENLFSDAKKIKHCGSQVTMLSSLTYSQLRAKDCSSKVRSLRTKTNVVFQGAGAGTDFWVSMYRRANENYHVVELCIGDKAQSTVHCINAELDQAFIRIVNDWRNLGTGVLSDGGGDRRTLGSVMLHS